MGLFNFDYSISQSRNTSVYYKVFRIFRRVLSRDAGGLVAYVNVWVWSVRFLLGVTINRVVFTEPYEHYEA